MTFLSVLADSPTPIAVLHREQRDLPQDLARRSASRELSPDRLGKNEPEVMGQAVVEPSTPMMRRIPKPERGPHPDLAFAQLDRTGWNVVRPQVERAAACEIEAGVMPMTGQDSVLDAAALERKALVRTAVVECEDVCPPS